MEKLILENSTQISEIDSKLQKSSAIQLLDSDGKSKGYILSEKQYNTMIGLLLEHDEEQENRFDEMPDV